MARKSATTATVGSTQAKPKRSPRAGRNPKAKDTAKGDGKGMAEGSPTMIMKRREMIASWRLRGATYSEIEAKLVEAGFKNPSRGTPWSRGVIADDLKVARDQWMANAAADIKEHYSRVLAELEEVKRAAWEKGDHASVLRALAQECKMFGFNAPVKLQITQQPAKPGEVNPEPVLADMGVDQLRVLYDVYSQLMAQGQEPMTVAATLISSQPVAT